MLKRTFIVLGGILAVVYVPYLIGRPFDEYIRHQFNWPAEKNLFIIWMTGMLSILLAIIAFNIIKLLYNYIINGEPLK